MGVLTVRALRSLSSLLAVALLAGALPLWLAAGRVPELDVHGVPWRTHTGRLLARYPLGQRFRCEADGLRRIEVALVDVRRPPTGGVLLRLYEERPDGAADAAPLRAVELAPAELPQGGAFVAFDFEPVADSAGRTFRLELEPTGEARPGDRSAFVRMRGQVGHEGSWGWVEHRETTIEGRLRHVFRPEARRRLVEGDVSKPDEVPHANLRAVAFPAIVVAPRAGEVQLELWEEGADGPPLRSVTLGPENEVHGGWLLFGFEPLPDSRWKRYRYRLTLHPQAIVLGDEQGPSMLTFHGTDGGDPRLLGATLGGLPYPDRDLVFRAWCAPDRGLALARMARRAGPALPLGAALWLVATALLGLALRRART